jgi:hypothetical protein
VAQLIKALQGNTDETPLLFENIADYTVDLNQGWKPQPGQC